MANGNIGIGNIFTLATFNRMFARAGGECCQYGNVASTNSNISPVLGKMQNAVGAKHAFQVVMNLPFIQSDAFAYTAPVVVPARTFLAQLP